MKSKHAVKLLQCTHTTLHNYVKSGKIKAVKRQNGYYEYDDDSVCRLVSESAKAPEGYVLVRKNDGTTKTFCLNTAETENIMRYCEKVGKL